MNLSNLAVSQESFTLKFKSPVTNKEMGLTLGEPISDGNGGFMSIDILSSDTNVMKKAMHDMNKEAKLLLKGADEITDREAYLIQCRAIAKATTGCNLTDEDNKKIKHSEVAIFDIISKPDFTWVKDQLTREMDNRNNFMKA